MGATGIPQAKEEASIFFLFFFFCSDFLVRATERMGSTNPSRRAWTTEYYGRRYSSVRVRVIAHVEMREPAFLETKFRDGDVEV
jgi:hypothetical protein